MVKTAGYFLLDKIIRMMSSILQKYIVDQLCEERVKAVDFANVSNQIKAKRTRSHFGTIIKYTQHGMFFRSFARRLAPARPSASCRTSPTRCSSPAARSPAAWRPSWPSWAGPRTRSSTPSGGRRRRLAAGRPLSSQPSRDTSAGTRTGFAMGQASHVRHIRLANKLCMYFSLNWRISRQNRRHCEGRCRRGGRFELAVRRAQEGGGGGTLRRGRKEEAKGNELIFR